MKKLFFVLACILLGNAASAQGILDRFSDPEKGRTVFIPKGNHAIGIGASYRSFEASGENAGDGYSILSLLNIGDGRLNIWSVSPSLCWFVADDFSLGVRLDYSGYRWDTPALSIRRTRRRNKSKQDNTTSAACHLTSGALSGGDSQIRTGDPLLAKQVLYQLSYTPGRVVPRGVEPRTSTLSVWRSNPLS